MYDKSNIFARMVRKEISCNVVKETALSLSFYDINPQAPIHVLVIPKGPYVHMGHFLETSSVKERNDFFDLVSCLPGVLGVRESGYRWIANAGPDAHQEIDHFHMHLLAGKTLPLFKDGKVVQP